MSKCNENLDCKDTSPLVSIIMGTYNCEDTIANCVESIQKQTYTNWEFIICDDCSTDATFSVLKRYAKQDRRIHLLRNRKNMKLAKTLNNCLSVALGNYVARMDSDDISLPERLTKQIEFLQSYPQIDVVGCNSIVFNENGDVGVRTVPEFPTKEVLLRGVPFMHPTIVMKKSVYDALGGYMVSKKTKRSQDLELWFRFYQAGYRGYNLQEPLYRYRETCDDYKKRTWKTGFNAARICLEGYSKLGYPAWKYIFAFKPLLSVLIPGKWMAKYHKNKLKMAKK